MELERGSIGATVEHEWDTRARRAERADGGLQELAALRLVWVVSGMRLSQHTCSLKGKDGAASTRAMNRS